MISSRKRIFSLVVAFFLVVTNFTISFGQSVVIHERKTSENISSGVVHEHIQKFTNSGWWNINVLRVNLNDEYTEIRPIFSNEGISKRERISKMVQDQNAVAGINGDFFASFNYSSPLGIVVRDGEIISTVTEREDNLPTLAIDKNNQVLLSYWTTSIRVLTEQKNIINVKSKNKASSNYSDIRLYDKEWSKKTFGNTLFADMVEVIVIDDQVMEVRNGEEAIDMPVEGYILAGAGNAGKILLENFKVGDRVELEIVSYPDYENIKAALGGGAVIVREGESVKNTNDINITGDQPRTAIGISRDRRQIILVTLDGRHTSYKGMTQEAFSKILIELGAYEALNLDGGGSTTMVVNQMGSPKPIVVNNPSDGGERLVANGLGVFNNAPSYPIDYIKISADDTNVFQGTSREFTVKGFDIHHNPADLDIEDVTFEIDSQYGYFEASTLKAKAPGLAIVKANLNGKTTEMRINILEEVKDIEVDMTKIHLDVNSERNLRQFYGVNDEGFTAKIDPKDISWNIVGDIGKIEDGTIYSGSKATSGYITASVGSAIESILVTVGYNKIPIHDFESIEDIGFTTYPQTVTGDISLRNKAKEGNRSLRLTYDFTQSEDTRAAYVLLGNEGITLKDKPNKIGMWVYGNKSEHWLRGKLVDNEGTSYNIDFSRAIDWDDWKWVTADIPANVTYPVKLERVYLAETDPSKKDMGQILIDDLASLYVVTVDKSLELPKETMINDPLMKKLDLAEGGYRFTVASGINQDDTLLKNHIGNKITKAINNTDFGLILGNLNAKFNADLTKPNMKVNTGHGAVSHKNTLFIRLDDTKNGIRATDYNQWFWLKEKLSKPIEKNIILSLSKEVFGDNGFTDKLEAQLLEEVLLEQREKGKNIFVITEGQKTEVQVRTGIRYIKLNKSNTNKTADIFNLEYILFTVNGDNIGYEILPLFPRAE
ncbi:MAG: phosphodiester glycosidase family protein [Tissierellales bacterium]